MCLSATACLSPPPCLFERNRSSVAHTMSIQAPAPAHHPRHVFLSIATRASPPLSLFKHQHLPVTLAVSLRAQLLVYHPHCTYLSATTCISPLPHPTARLSPPPCLFECQGSPITPTMLFEGNHLCIALTVSIQAQPLASLPHCI